MNSPTLLIVLSMHRSGSSLIAHSLRIFGAKLGDDLLPASHSNETGYWEDHALVTLNDEILNHLNMRWYMLRRITPDDCGILNAAGFGERCAAFMANLRQRGDVLAIKDPRMAKLLPFWAPIIEQTGMNVNYIVPLRHPQHVADSLAKRDGIRRGHAIQLWCAYNMEILDGTTAENRSFVAYNDVINDPETMISRLSKSLGINADPEAIEQFARKIVRPDLNHSQSAPAPSKAPTQAEKIYAVLHQIPSDATLTEHFPKWKQHWLTQQKNLAVADDFIRAQMIGPHPYPNENRSFRNTTGWRKWVALGRGVNRRIRRFF